MRVSINHDEVSHGVFKKTIYHQVEVKVDFSEEELAIIKQNNLEDTIVLERTNTAYLKYDEELADIYPLKISDLMSKHSDIHALDTPLEAKQYEASLTEALQQLKAYIEENAEVETKSTTFEL